MQHYPSKLLLFGEHTLLIGSPALAVPMPVFRGQWVESAKSIPTDLQQKLIQFAKSDQLASIEELDNTRFLQDLKSTLVFDSNIPIGYGLGSSGALCAAVYDRYCQQKTADLGQLKSIFAQMESFFHGASSGIDPLTSYVRQALLIQDKTTVTIPNIQAFDQPPLLFLIDSGLPRQTGVLVSWFLARYEALIFRQKLERSYLPAQRALVQAWLEGHEADFWTNLRQVSAFQLAHFEPMIPATLREIWTSSLKGQELTFKICGAGGGGYMMGFSRSMQAVENLSKKHKIVFPFDTKHDS